MTQQHQHSTFRTIHRSGLTLGAITLSMTVLVACSGTTAAPSVTAQAVATQAAPITATVTAAAPVRMTNARVTGNDANVTLQNTGDQAVDLSGWSLLVGTARAQLPNGFALPAAKSVTVHATSGTNSDSDLYLGQDSQTLVSQLRPGVTIALNNPAGGTVSSFVVPNG